jgi:serine/threonine protein kinase
MLKEEIKLLTEINCLSIVSFFGAFLFEKKVSIILEFMDRGSLEDLILYVKRSSSCFYFSISHPLLILFYLLVQLMVILTRRDLVIDEHLLCGMSFQMIHGLHYLNSIGLMHRDIKPPSNCNYSLNCASTNLT